MATKCSSAHDGGNPCEADATVTASRTLMAGKITYTALDADTKITASKAPYCAEHAGELLAAAVQFWQS